MKGRVKEAIIVSAAVALSFMMGGGLLTRLDSMALKIEYRLRGPVRMDSSIVVMSLNDSLINSMGSIPLRWSYYRVLLNALDGLGVRAVAITIPFDPKGSNSPLEASLLAGELKQDGNVCIGGFFRKIRPEKLRDTIRSNLSASHIGPRLSGQIGAIAAGKGFQPPPAVLANSAEGVGLLNYNEYPSGNTIPLVVEDVRRKKAEPAEIVPSIVLELLRLAFRLPSDSITVQDSRILLHTGRVPISIPISAGSMAINYCGGTKHLNMISTTDFLKLYNSYVESGSHKKFLMNFHDKIVLIGLAANHFGEFASTPFSSRFPVVGVYANALDTILRHRFFTTIPRPVDILFTILFTAGLFLLLSEKTIHTPVSFIAAACVTVGYCLLAFALFVLNVSLPIDPVIFGSLAIVGGMLNRLNFLTLHNTAIEKKISQTENLLRHRGARLAALEGELSLIRHRLSRDLKFDGQDDTVPVTETDTVQPDAENTPEVWEEFNGIVFGKGSRMSKVVELVRKVADSDATVLILGESGTGKELIASAIHESSPRKERNFVAINCGAIPESLLESELFGHEEGAFTSANKSKKGLFEAADKGTIFLDEIAETSEFFQVKLLRILQSGEFNRVGSTEVRKVDVRVLAATNRKIEDLVSEEKFRRDVYYRLNVIRIHLPALRERRSDVPALIRYFLNKDGAGEVRLGPSVSEALRNYSWPGNVRELESTIKRALILARAENRDTILLKDVPEEVTASFKSRLDLERQILESVRARKFSRSSIRETARELGSLHRSTVTEYLRGMCFKEYCDNHFNVRAAAAAIAGTEEEEILKRVEKKLKEYLSNFESALDRNRPPSRAKEETLYRYRKLPVKYQPYLEVMVDRIYQNSDSN